MKTPPAPFVLITVLAALALPTLGQPQLELVNGGFEIFEPTANGAPTTLNDWSGDFSIIRLLPEAGISPRTGSGMLEFQASRTGSAGSQTTCEMFHLISLDPLRLLLDNGWTVTVTQTCYFNRVAGDEQTDTAYGSTLDAHAGAPSIFPSRIVSGWLTNASAGLYSDSDPATWEQVSLSLTIPAAATFLAVRLAAGEDIFNDSIFPEFDGHFADDVSLTIGVEPPRPRLDVVLAPDANLVLLWPSFPAFLYQVQRSPSLTHPDWQPSGGPRPGTGGLMAAIDVPGLQSRYYRLLVTPRH